MIDFSHLSIIPQEVVVPSGCTDVLQQVEASISRRVNSLSVHGDVVCTRQVFVDASTRDRCAAQVTGSSVAAFTWSRPQRDRSDRMFMVVLANNNVFLSELCILLMLNQI